MNKAAADSAFERALVNLASQRGDNTWIHRLASEANADFEKRLLVDALDRPHYAYGVMQAARQATRLGLSQICVLELGVAAGHGLLSLENHAKAVSELAAIEILVIGFDSGTGMPQATDYRDLPYVWKEGYFRMDRALLEKELSGASLVIGNVAETIPDWLRTCPPPIGFVAFDLDYYSSTNAALDLFRTDDTGRLLPRVFCYFDDIIGNDEELHSEFSGELLAIREFNTERVHRKIAAIHGLRHKRLLASRWNDQMYVAHIFDHPEYSRHIGLQDWQYPLSVAL